MNWKLLNLIYSTLLSHMWTMIVMSFPHDAE
jgi:hypothetical protein